MLLFLLLLTGSFFSQTSKMKPVLFLKEQRVHVVHVKRRAHTSKRKRADAFRFLLTKLSAGRGIIKV